MALHSRAPVRFDFAGGWTDVSLFCRETRGCVLNATLGIYSYASLYPINGEGDLRMGNRARAASGPGGTGKSDGGAAGGCCEGAPSEGASCDAPDRSGAATCHEASADQANGYCEAVRSGTPGSDADPANEDFTLRSAPRMIGSVNSVVEIYSADLDVYLQAETIRKLEYDGNVDLIKAALRQYPAKGGFRIVTSSNAPAGSGLGTSAAMGVALMTLISTYNDQPLIAHEAAEAASFIETDELGILGGKQDHYASAFGGCLFMEFDGESVQVSPLKIPAHVSLTLERDLILCYTGKSRLSGDIHRSVTEAYKAGNAGTVGAIERLKSIAQEMKFALMDGKLAAFARLMSENWQCQKRLHPSVTNPQIDHLFELAYSNGAIGGKAGGAGGGGCLMFYCEPERRRAVHDALIGAGVTVINFNFDSDGVCTWRTDGRA